MAVYLDHNATTPLDERVLEAMLPYMQGLFGNASSVHRYGRLVRGAIDQAREQVAALVGAHPSQVVFTSCGTEANNLAVRGVAESQSAPARMLIGSIEHASLRDPAVALKGRGWQVEDIAITPAGVFDVEAFSRQLNANDTLVSAMLANNETGAIQPVAALAEQARAQGVPFHTDASQAAGKIAVDFNALGVNLMTISAHKIYGPLGAGALITDKTVTLQPQLRGGGHERGLRSGTENVAAIVGFGKAAELALAELEQRRQHWLALRQQLEKGLAGFSPVTIFARETERLPNTVQFGIAGFHGETTLMKLDCRAIAVSSGSACHADRADPSHVLLAMGVDPALALTAIRTSIGKDSSAADIEQLLQAIAEIVASPLESAALAANL